MLRSNWKGLCLSVLVLGLTTLPTTASGDSRVRGMASNVISAGKAHAFVVVTGSAFGATGTFAWGNGTNYELGSGSNTSSTTPVQVGSPGYAQIAAGTSFTIAIDHFGKMYGWGVNGNDQTGSTAASPVKTPTRIGSSNNWKYAAAGASHAAAITGSGQLYTWGQNSDGEIGNGMTATSQSTPYNVVPAASWIGVSAGNQFTVGIESDGSLWTWGHNSSGQLGINSTNPQHSPTHVTTTTTPWVAVAAGDSHVLGITADGKLWAWGLNDKGQIGNNSTTNALTPQPIAGTWVAVAAGAHDSFAIRSDGTLWAWGDNSAGQLGCSGCASPQKTPYQVGTANDYQYVAAGYDFTVAMTADGNLLSWGNNGSGQLGNGKVTATVPTRVPDTGVATFTAIKPGQVGTGGSDLSGNYSGASAAHIKSSGLLETWGNDAPADASDEAHSLGLASGQTGTLNQLSACGGLDYCETGAYCSSAGSTCSDGTLCVGYPSTCWTPVPVAYVQTSPGTYAVNTIPWTQVSVGRTYMLALRADGTAWGWGNNAYGEVGTGGTSAVILPTQVKAGSAPWLKIAAAPANTLSYGIEADGTLWAWGSGVGSTPVKACTSGACNGELWATVAPASPGNVLAVSADGKLWSFHASSTSADQLTGSNGDSTWTNLTWLDAQTFTGGGATIASAIDSAGNLWGWGDSEYGSIGDGVNAYDGSCAGGAPVYPPNQAGGCKDAAPKQIVHNVLGAVRCDLSAMALDAQNNLWIWGQNEEGEIGTNGGGSPDTGVAWAVNAMASNGDYGMCENNGNLCSNFNGNCSGNGGTCLEQNAYWNYLSTPILSLGCGGYVSFVEDSVGTIWTTGQSDGNSEQGIGYMQPGGSDMPNAQPNAIFPMAYEPNGFSASVNSGDAIGINSGATWSTSPAKQASGQWLDLDLGAPSYMNPRYYTAIKIESGSSNYPRQYEVMVSTDQVHWSAPIATGAGTGPDMTISFPVQTAEFVRIQLTASATVPWDVQVLDVEY